jgi:uroporphyrinogen-III synthase
MRLIVTRPEPDDMRTGRALMRLGHEAILSPMLDIVLDAKAPIPERSYQAVLVTSSNAVRALAARALRPVAADIPLLAVGDQTALEAKRAGFAAARSAGGALDDLVTVAKRDLSPAMGPLLYAAGEERSGDLAGELAEKGFEVETAVVYRAHPRKTLANVAKDALKAGAVDGVLFYSRRSAAAFALALRTDKLAPLGAKVACFCISEAAAEALGRAVTGKVLVAEKPNQIALFSLVEAEAASRQVVEGG